MAAQINTVTPAPIQCQSGYYYNAQGQCQQYTPENSYILIAVGLSAAILLFAPGSAKWLALAPVGYEFARFMGAVGGIT
jgi:hypothetical protein